MYSEGFTNDKSHNWKKGKPVLYEYVIHRWCTFQLLACKFRDRDQCVSTSNTKNTWLSGIYLIFVCQLTVVNLLSPGPVHQTLDNAIHRIDHSPLDKYQRNVSAFSTGKWFIQWIALSTFLNNQGLEVQLPFICTTLATQLSTAIVVIRIIPVIYQLLSTVNYLL